MKKKFPDFEGQLGPTEGVICTLNPLICFLNFTEVAGPNNLKALRTFFDTIVTETGKEIS